MTILALDPSTSTTGIALVEFVGYSVPTVLYHSAITAGPKADRWTRIRETRNRLSRVLAYLPAAFDAVAYEVPFVRGQAATAALHQAIGAYLSLSGFAGFEALPIMPNSAKAALNACRFLPHYETSAEQVAGRAHGKALMIDAVNTMFGLCLRPDEDAVADAIGVALAAHKITSERHRITEAKRLQPKLRITLKAARSKILHESELCQPETPILTP